VVVLLVGGAHPEARSVRCNQLILIYQLEWNVITLVLVELVVELGAGCVVGGAEEAPARGSRLGEGVLGRYSRLRYRSWACASLHSPIFFDFLNLLKHLAQLKLAIFFFDELLVDGKGPLSVDEVGGARSP